MKNFALIGAAGFVAPRHMRAIKDTSNQMVAALDKHDAVGIIDSYFPAASFFTEFERFDRHIDKLRRKQPDMAIDYVSICSPNYLHDAHIRFAFRSGADAVCEKPLVLNPWNLDALVEIEELTGRKVNNILQLRLHPSIAALKEKIDREARGHKYEVDLVYITARGNWYPRSWKGDIEKSGGIATNVGIHLFDMLSWVFGKVEQNSVHISSPLKTAGYLEYEKARVRWLLSIDGNDLPEFIKAKQQRTFRSITIEDREIEFSTGFADLHTLSYQGILNGHGFGIDDARASIETVYAIKHATPEGLTGDYHPYLQRISVD